MLEEGRVNQMYELPWVNCSKWSENRGVDLVRIAY